MTNNLSSSLAGLSLLSGSNMGSFGIGGLTVESRAVRLAREQFTAEPVTPPWKEKAPATALSGQVAAVRAMASIIDNVRATGPSLPPDIRTAFTTYKALDRLRVLAETAMRSTASVAERDMLQSTFSKGVADLQAFLSGSPSDKLNFAFAKPTRRAESVAVPPATNTTTKGEVVTKERAAPLAGLTGNETFTLTLSKTGGSDTVTVNLAATPQPPTLDSVAAAFNAAIAAVPMRNADGTLALNSDGQTQPRWLSKFEAVRSDTGWGLALKTVGIEEITIDQVGAGDALMVATGQTALDAPTATALMRFDAPAGAMERSALGTIQALDRSATEAAALLPQPKRAEGLPKPEPVQVMASTTTRAIATDANGFSYIVGTTAGDLGINRGDGQDDLFLSKLDGDGNVVWQRTLGTAGRAEGAAVTVAANGNVVVAGTVTGGLDGLAGDSDMLVARFDAKGNETFATVVRSVGADSASAVAVGANGAIYVGGRAASGMGDAFIARLDAGGRLQERRTIDSGSSDAVRSLAVAADGSLVALTSENGIATVRRMSGTNLATSIGAISLGSADARALAIGADGSIAVGGATAAALNGTQVNAKGNARDGFVARIDADLSSVATTYVGTAEDDQIDSVTFMGAAIYAGGRTRGSLSGTKTGSTDGFVSRLDAATGAVQLTQQFGRPAIRMEPVRVAAAKGGDHVLGALGLTRGTINPAVTDNLVSQTSLRTGDSFSIRVDGGTTRKVVIEAKDTLQSLATRIRLLAGANIAVTTPKSGDGNVLRIDAKPGHSIDLIAGAPGQDALAKLGIAPARLVAAPPRDEDAPKVSPGGTFGLELSTGMNIRTQADATAAFGRLKSAISMTQTAFRSLYWDDSKAALAAGTSGKGGGSLSAYQSAQLGRYRDALSRLSGPAPSNLGF